MARAGLFIGVDRTGQLDPLSDAAAGAARMHAWFCTVQGTPLSHAQLVTDEGGRPVTVDAIYDACEQLLKLPDVDQLLVYFAGHGIYANGSEQWLLTHAPARASAAIDLGVSIEHARRLPLSYVAIVADTCRVAPAGIQATGVRGQSLFPNLAQRGRSKPVDVFFASLRGQGAGEIPTASEAAREYRAIYTTSLLHGLSGGVPDVLESIDPQDSAMYVMPPLLADYLEEAVPEALIAARVAHLHDQLPDFVPSGRHSFWLARIADPPRVERSARTTASANAGNRPLRVGLPQLLSTIADDPVQALGDAAIAQRLDYAFGNTEPTRTAAELAQPFGAEGHETGCGIKLRGATLESAIGRTASVEAPYGAHDDVRVHVPNGPESAVITASIGGSTFVPVVHGYFTALTFDGPSLIEVALDPMPMWSAVAVPPEVLTRVRALRASVSTAARYGRLRPRGRTLARLVDAAMYGDGRMDVTCGLLLAYAAHDANDTDVVARVRDAVRTTVPAPIFDLELLAHLHDLRPWVVADASATATISDGPYRPADVLPPVPLLARGWVLVDAGLAAVPSPLASLRDSLMDSLWSLYHPRTTSLLIQADGHTSFPNGDIPR